MDLMDDKMLRFGVCRLIAIFTLVYATGALTVGNTAETKPNDRCPLCDAWRPYSSVGSAFDSNDLLVISQVSLALPGCSPARAHVLRQGFQKDCVEHRNGCLPEYVLYELDEDPQCKRAKPPARRGSLVELLVDESQFGAGSERMEARIVETTKDAYEPHKSPVKIKWYLIRSDYNPGDEGSGYGALIASEIEHRRIDDKLNKEWRRLLRVVNENKRAELIRRQRLWLKAIDKRCRQDGGAAPQWESVYFVSCLSGAFEKRIEQFQDLRECIMEKRTPCPALTTDDPGVNNMDYR
jgi:hypothetical protein